MGTSLARTRPPHSPTCARHIPQRVRAVVRLSPGNAGLVKLAQALERERGRHPFPAHPPPVRSRKRARSVPRIARLENGHTERGTPHVRERAPGSGQRRPARAARRPVTVAASRIPTAGLWGLGLVARDAPETDGVRTREEV